MFSSLFASTHEELAALTNEIRDEESCVAEYQKLRATSRYPPLKTTTSTTADEDNRNKNPLAGLLEWSATASFCRQLLAQQRQQHQQQSTQSQPNRATDDSSCWPMRDRLCLVTGVCEDSPAFYVAQELAVTGRMHVIIAGRNLQQLKLCQRAIQKEALLRAFDGQVTGVVVHVCSTKFHLASLDSIRRTAKCVMDVAHGTDGYHGQLHCLVHMAHVGTGTAKLTADGIEYNTGCNFVGTHYLTKLLMPLFPRNNGNHANGDDTAARVVHVNSMGHCLGTNFSPRRFVHAPQEGGAPEGFLQQVLVESAATLGGGDDFDDDEAMSPPIVSPQTALLSKAAYDQPQQPKETIQVNEQETKRAVRRSGTQVGRSKMAALADLFATSRLHPHVRFVAFHLVPQSASSSRNKPTTTTTTSSTFSTWWWWNVLPSSTTSGNHAKAERAAWPALRAVLDDTLFAATTTTRTDNATSNCRYLHADGNSWTPMAPAMDPVFGTACFQAAETILQQKVKTPDLPPAQAAYVPPTLIHEKSRRPE